MATRSSLAVCASLALAVPLAAAAPAAAKPPPRGKYGCSNYATGFAGNLFIMRDNRYRVDDSRVGRFRDVGRRLRFRSGVWKGLFRGKWERTENGEIEISLTSIESGFESTYCVLEKRA